VQILKSVGRQAGAEKGKRKVWEFPLVKRGVLLGGEQWFLAKKVFGPISEKGECKARGTPKKKNK